MVQSDLEREGKNSTRDRMGHKMMDNEKEEEQKERTRKREDKKEERACDGLTGGHPKRHPC